MPLGEAHRKCFDSSLDEAKDLFARLSLFELFVEDVGCRSENVPASQKPQEATPLRTP